MAMKLLRDKGVEFEQIDVTFDPGERAKMRDLANGQNSTPQIFFGDRHIGGCDDLYALDRDGKLDAIIAEAAE